MITWIAYLLCSIGAINWGLTKFFNFNLVEYIGDIIRIAYLKELVYLLVSLSGLYVLINLFM